MQINSQCAQDVSYLSGDISTITPDTTVGGHPSYSALGVSGMAADSAGFLNSSMLASFRQSGLEQPSLHEASFGTSAPPQPSPGMFASEQKTQYLGGVANGLQGLAPDAVTPHLYVHQEDFHNAELLKGSYFASEPPRAFASGAKSLEAAIHGDIYVQPMTETQRFKPVPVQRMRRAFGQVKQVTERQQVSVRRQALWSSCAAFDIDAAQLQTGDRLDVDILELLAGSLQCQISAAAAFWTCQALLAGLSLVAGLAWLSSGDDGKLVDVLQALEPGFGSLKLLLAEISCAGNALRLFWTWEKVSAMRADGLDESTTGESNNYHYLFQNAAIDAVRMITNASFYTCCLLSTRGNVIVLYVEDVLDSSWSASFARNLLAAQALLGILALIFAGNDLFDLISPRFPATSSLGETIEDGAGANR
mmetsp:Transcript_78007/g.123055  ORF Transcript_78007/g.123055 Transcript_78007/m.123055 type:complete len:420 (-) Transcript_78007:110-1369(-)